MGVEASGGSKALYAYVAFVAIWVGGGSQASLGSSREG